MRAVYAAMVATALIASGAVAQQRETWSWTEALRPGQTLEIKGINGEIRAVGTRGADATIQVVKHGRRHDPREIEMVVVQNRNGYTICAVYPTPPRARQKNECAPGSDGHNSVNNNDVTVDFRVHVPQGVALVARTVNGNVEASGLTGEVRGHTVNGSISLATAGLARASTVNGSIDVDLGRAVWEDLLEFETVNGNITVTLPENMDASVNASTVSGSITTDFPITVRGRFGPRRLSGTIGRGGRELSLGTVNGNIDLRRR